jgi:hypothetical protein
MMELRALRTIVSSLALVGLAVPAFAASPPVATVRNLPPVKPPPPLAPPVFVDPEVPLSARNLHRDHCRPDAVAIVDDSALPPGRVTFAATPNEPARLILCDDRLRSAFAVPIANMESALVFMSIREFAPFWPAAEARWGADLAILRKEVQGAPTEEAVQSYPYYSLADERTSRAIVGSRIAVVLGDYDRGVSLVQDEIDFIAAHRAKRPGSKRYDFELSLLLGRLVNALSKRDGAAAAADRMEQVLAANPVPPEYYANAMINYAAVLAEAGRGEQSLAVIEPVYAAFRPNLADGRVYEIPGSVREFSWIIACGHHLNGAPDKAAPYMAIVNTHDEKPVDPYVTWTKSSTDIRLRMYKCMGDEAGFLKAWNKSNVPLLSPLWLEFQTHSRAIVGARKFQGLADSAAGQALFADYRQLPESYRAALEGWRQAAPAE